eukprot:11194259-Lingulodinium_polyedra.AAC.1
MPVPFFAGAANRKTDWGSQATNKPGCLLACLIAGFAPSSLDCAQQCTSPTIICLLLASGGASLLALQ